MNIAEKEINHLASLSNFSLTPEEKKSLKGDLENIIKYISELSELKTDDVEPTFQVFEVENVWRPDEILPMEADREALLSLTVEERNNEIKVPKVL